MIASNLILKLNALAGFLILLIFFYAAIVCRREKQRRAFFWSVILGVFLALPFLVVAVLNVPARPLLALILLMLALSLTVITILPLGAGRIEPGPGRPAAGYDERRIMFSRAELNPGTERFHSYYLEFPQDRQKDDLFRLKPGLLSPRAVYAEPLAFASSRAAFTAVKAFHHLLDDQPEAKTGAEISPTRATRFIKTWLKKMGAASAGITELQDYHLYSVIGRGESYGRRVELEHRFAIALTVEMDFDNVASAPYAPIIMESARQYLNSGALAVQLAGIIRELGYPARAHIDGNYRVICPLVARDAGLGEIGRMGLLMTPQFGPRVRIAVVSTDLPLLTDQLTRDPSVIDFCRICRKCAETCPGQAIPHGDRELEQGSLRWRIDSEACFTYWCQAGTDCGRCISVCPYSHPANLMHDAIRFGVRRSPLFRRLALHMDHLFYGRKPAPRPMPDWLKL